MSYIYLGWNLYFFSRTGGKTRYMKPSLKAWHASLQSRSRGQPKEYVRTIFVQSGGSCPANSWRLSLLSGPYIIPTGFMQLARTHARLRVSLTQGGMPLMTVPFATCRVETVHLTELLHCSERYRIIPDV